MARLVSRIGERYTTKEGYEVEIIEYFNCHNCTIKFSSNTYILYKRWYKDIQEGCIKNPYHPSVHGTGFLGVGDYNYLNGKVIYSYWRGVLERSYCKKYFIKRPTYVGCSVDERWHNFQNFAKWFEENYVEGFQLDKDILVKGNKVYSPETCAFVPQEINGLFTKGEKVRGVCCIGVTMDKARKSYIGQLNRGDGVNYLGTFRTEIEAFQAYKTAKEDYIKKAANKWKDKIDIRVYEAMYNYQVEITD